MMKKVSLAFVFSVLISGVLFAQEENPGVRHKHESMDMLIGLNFGGSITPNPLGLLFNMLICNTSSGRIGTGRYILAATMDIGMTYEFYPLYWLSFNTGALLHPTAYAVLNQNSDTSSSLFDILRSPLCLTIPLAFHVNVPKAEWLYMGAGATYNIPLIGILDRTVRADTKGDPFWALPIDFGFDFMRAGGKGGTRLFFRVTPEFHPKEITVPIGFMLQIYNWKIFGKKK